MSQAWLRKKIAHPSCSFAVRWHGRSLAVPLVQLQPMAVDTETREAVGDWHYWLGRGYEF